MKDRFNFRTPIYGADGKFKKFVYWNAESGFPAVTCREGSVFKNPEQCTGLKDQNGRLIYEGDIVQVYECAQPYIRGVVKYGKFIFSKCAEYRCEHVAFFIAAEFYNYVNCTGFSLDIEEDKYEVIGNIHENPELLEGKK